MSTLTSASTLAQKQAAYDDNMTYQEDGSVAKAHAFISACRALMRVTPADARTGNAHSISIDTKLLPGQIVEAQRYIASQRTASVVYPNMNAGFRG